MVNDLAYKGKRLSVVGAGVSGRSLAELAKKLGTDVFVSELKEMPQETAEALGSLGIKWESGGNTRKLLEADEIIVSSGIPSDIPILLEASSQGIPVTSELDFVYPFLSGKIIAITGSNGKTTPHP